MSILALHGISRRFEGVTAVDGVDMELGAGARHVIFGPNGAGKTTLFRVICGELPPSSGTVELFGRPATQLAVARRARLGLGRTFQLSTLFPGLSVRDSLRLACQSGERARHVFWRSRTRSGGVERRVQELLDSHALAHRAEQRVGVLSYGEQRLLELALALGPRPRLLLLDEPSAGLSGAAAERVVDRLRALDDELCMVLIEHDLEVAFRVAVDATVLDFGRVVAQGPLADVRASPVVRRLYLGDLHGDEQPTSN